MAGRLRAISFILGAALAVVTAPAGHGQSLTAETAKTYRSAFDASHNGQWERARRLAAEGGQPILARAIDWLRLSSPKSNATLAEFILFVEANPAWDGFADISRQAERQMTADSEDAEVLRWFRGHEALTTRGDIAHVRALLASGDTGRAGALARETWLTGYFGPQQEADFLKRFGHFLRPGDHERRLDHLIWNRRYTSARRMLPRVAKDSKVVAEARLKLARQRKGVDAAIQRVPSHLKDDPGLVYERIRWNRRKKREEAAVALLASAPRAMADHARKWWTERNLAARWLLREGRPAEAYAIAAGHGQTEGLAFAAGEWMAGWIALRFLSDPKRAVDHFGRLHAGVTSPVSRARGAYWAGRAAGAMGRGKEAQNWYRDAARHGATYYGQLAAARLPTAERPGFDRPPAVGAARASRFEDRELVRAASLLKDLGEDGLTGRILRHMEQNASSPSESRLIGRLALRLGQRDIAVRAARRTYAKGQPMQSFGYPVIPLADVAMVEVPFVHAVIRQESAFIPRAVSHAGARGLMQMMPATAKGTAKRSGVPYSRSRLLDDPNYNTTLGQLHLRELLNEFGNSYVLTLAGYNAGKHRVARWLDTYGDPRHPSVDAVDWVESIPFSETRDYVQRVLENLQVYRWLVNGTQLAAQPHDTIYDSGHLARN
jgi:soluble lytic murein transglycosylase